MVHAAAAMALLVILDPGHGGSDTGAIAELHGRKVYEKDITLAIAGAAMRSLRARGLRVALTRGDDRFVTLDRRTRLANEAAAGTKGAVFVSIHANSSDDHTSEGAELYVLNATSNEGARRLADIENGHAPRTPGKRPALLTERDRNHGTLDLILTDLATTGNYTESVSLACSVDRSFLREAASRGARPRDRGVRQALFYVLMDTHVPGILFEPGFLSNPRDLARLLSPGYQNQIGRSLADGILRWHAAQQASISGRKVSGISKSRLPCRMVKD
jgi:N-acetylmuramoyl-L-alanine amidase